MEPHIASAFDRDLEALTAHLVRMSGLVEKALLQSAEALEALDTSAAALVREGDNAIDALDETIQLEAARLIAIRQPAASDLRVVLAIMRVASGLERVGDYAKNVAKRTQLMKDRRQLEGATGTLRRMSRIVAEMLDQAITALVRRDVDLATRVRASDVDVDQMYNNMFRSLLTHMLEDPANITTAMHLHFIAKNIERAGDHATGIAEQAIYLATGNMPGDDRPKVDAVVGSGPTAS
ncbi:MAG: phosphate signaling complex protein PhoU [Paracoccaceae bacterium]